VVGGRGTELAGQLDTRAGAELVGVDAEAEALGGAGGEDRPGLVRVEDAGLDEDETPEGAEERPS
jgi:hypothetical protein